MQPKLIAAIVSIAVLCIALVAVLIGLTQVLPQVQEELRTTPSPTPLTGNVMAVTVDPSVTATPAFNVLKNGSSGEAVSQLQQRLKELGYYSGTVDGQFGNGTRTAVKLFQEQNGLEADGVFGANTSAALYADTAKPCVTPTPSPTPTPTPTATPEPTATPTPARVKGYIRQDGLPLVVSSKFPLPDDYEPYDLICMNDYCDSSVVKIKYSDTYAEREAVDALMVMLEAAQADGLETWQISAAYRTVADQQRIFDNQVSSYMKNNDLSRSKAISATRRTVADPGCSEHHLGTSFDITVPNKTFVNTDQCKWLEEHAWEYGFIQRYASDKVSITGISNEVWHYRWVGLEHATIMHS